MNCWFRVLFFDLGLPLLALLVFMSAFMLEIPNLYVRIVGEITTGFRKIESFDGKTDHIGSCTSK